MPRVKLVTIKMQPV